MKRTAFIPLPKNARAVKGWKQFLFLLLQWTWGAPVNIAGGLLYLLTWPFFRHEHFGNAFITYVPVKGFGGVSLGLFIFINSRMGKAYTEDTRIHEYGHTIQCLLLGPLYWPVIALPSSIWCNFFGGWRRRNNVSYYALYCEKWANKLGEKWSGLKQKERN